MGVKKLTKDTRLTLKQEAFCIAFIETNDGVRAYQRAYNCKSESNARSAYKEAHRLIHLPHTAARIAALRREVAERAGILAADVVRELWDNALKAKIGNDKLDKDGKVIGQDRPDWSSSNQALIAVGNHLGVFAKKEDLDRSSPFDNLTHEQIKELIALLRAKKDEFRGRAKPAEPAPQLPDPGIPDDGLLVRVARSDLN
jgi:hypothetical protein